MEFAAVIATVSDKRESFALNLIHVSIVNGNRGWRSSVTRNVLDETAHTLYGSTESNGHRTRAVIQPGHRSEVTIPITVVEEAVTQGVAENRITTR